MKHGPSRSTLWRRKVLADPAQGLILKHRTKVVYDAWKKKNRERFLATRRARHAKRMADPDYRERKRVYSRLKAREWISKNRELIRARSKTPKAKAWRRAWDKKRSKTLAYKRYHSKWMCAHTKRRLATDPEYKIVHSIRVRMSGFLKAKKPRKTKELMGCTPAFLKSYLQEQFKPGMSWKNHGRTGWQIDHKRALATFCFFNEDGTVNETELKKAMHYTNLQPLWYWENASKGAKCA